MNFSLKIVYKQLFVHLQSVETASQQSGYAPDRTSPLLAVVVCCYRSQRCNWPEPPLQLLHPGEMTKLQHNLWTLSQ